VTKLKLKTLSLSALYSRPSLGASGSPSACACCWKWGRRLELSLSGAPDAHNAKTYMLNATCDNHAYMPANGHTGCCAAVG